MTWVMIAGWFVGWVLLWRLPGMREPVAPAARRRVSVVIPARNEVDRLPVLLASLQRQTRPADQIIVVDDDSSDGTGAVARSFAGVDVRPGTEVPDGWTGKSWACATGVAIADGDVLLFLDADVTLADDAIASLLTTWEELHGLVSVQPHHHIERPFESLSLPFNVVALMALGGGSLLPPRREWGASGPCLVTSRADYDAVGGHHGVAGAIAEDLALAERFVAAGLPVHCLGGDRIRFRMYRDGRSLVEGWSKNVATGACRTPILRGIGISLWVTALLTMALRVIEGPGDSFAETAAFLLSYAAGAVQVALLGRRVGRFGPAALVWPVLIGFFVAVFLLSAVRTLLLRRVRWSGRTVVLAEHC